MKEHPSYLRWIIRWRVPLAFIVIGLLLAKGWNERRIPHDPNAFLSGVLDLEALAGLVALVTGLFLRGWAAGIIRKGSQLCTEGPYALVRHPLYLGSFLIAMGFCALLGDAVNTIAVLAFGTVIYYPKVLSEEVEMSDRFPEYSSYRSAVPALIPWRLPRSVRAEWSFTQYAHHREYRATLASILALIVIDLVAGGALYR